MISYKCYQKTKPKEKKEKGSKKMKCFYDYDYKSMAKKVYRYMSLDEFSKLTAGLEIENKNQFGNCKTFSNGFCFLSRNIITEYITESYYETHAEQELIRKIYDPVFAYNFLSGIVSNEILVEFEVSPESNLTKSIGTYARPFSDDWDATMTIREYCTVKYNRNTLIPTRYTLDFEKKSFSDCIWYNVN